jgi:hypothetical protein
MTFSVALVKVEREKKAKQDLGRANPGSRGPIELKCGDAGG